MNGTVGDKLLDEIRGVLREIEDHFTDRIEKLAVKSDWSSLPRCDQCKHWIKSRGAYIDMGVCGKIPPIQTWKEEEPVCIIPTIPGWYDDPSRGDAPETTAECQTSEDFGCVMFEQKP